ncbi:hypothetical protein PQU92_04315 [Asticcacaulis sp. BYS171W]|uniref:DUF1176 domain-containing protein n=1 Tax=Asticcacaulis aquaticus TaxID=2984212 RepID=A0ABT5HQZ4_9CAUL|nr:hypothetical protein [Asticcacaulis aquaticus]MDC7682486.1 hypothetical protein [Asticcacaulis aquaticus]
MQRTLSTVAVIFAMLAGPEAAQAQTRSPRLIEQARIGTVREVLGAARYLAQPKSQCPQAFATGDGGPCLDGVVARLKAAGQTRARVLGVRHPAAAGEAIRGPYGQQARLYDVELSGKDVRWDAVELPISDVTVPRDCYALKGEGVFYTVERRGDQDVAQERQTVVCGGGPARPEGPYQPEGASIPLDPPSVGAAVNIGGEVWARTGTIRAEGAWRYLAVPEPGCPDTHLVRKLYCARSGIAYLDGAPDKKEVDMIAAKRPAQDGDLLHDDDIEQLVLKRQSKGYKADKRWFEKSMLTLPAGCGAAGAVGFRVHEQNRDLLITEEVLATCGAPLAPVPTDIYEAYGEARPVATVRRDCPPDLLLTAGACFADVVAYMKAFNHNALDVVVLTRPVRDGETVWQNYETAKVRFENGKYVAERKGQQVFGSIWLNRCNDMPNRPAEGRGYLIEWRGRALMAVAYEWKACPIY